MSANSGSNLEDEGKSSPAEAGVSQPEENTRPSQPTQSDPAQPVQPSPDCHQACPKCGTDLDGLECVEGGTNTFTFTASADNCDYTSEDSFPEWQEFKCLECGFLITTSQEEATDFLRDGTLGEAANERLARAALAVVQQA